MNIEGITLSNKFKTKNDDEVLEKLEGYGFTPWKDENGIEFGGYLDTCQWSNELDEDNFAEYLQEMLLDGQFVAIKETTNEGLRYNDGWCLFICKKFIRTQSLENFIWECAKEVGIKV